MHFINDLSTKTPQSGVGVEGWLAYVRIEM